MFHIPRNDGELDFLTKRMNEGRHKYFNDPVSEKKIKKLRDATCLFFGFPEGYQQLKAYWENNPKHSLGGEAYALICEDDSVQYFNKNEFSTSSSGLNRGFQMHCIHKEKSPRPINFSEDKIKEIADNYVFDSIYFQSKENENDFILDMSKRNILQTLYISEKLSGLQQYIPNANRYENDLTSDVKFDYFSKIPNLVQEYEGKLTRVMLIRLLKKTGYLMTVLDKNGIYEYELMFESTADLYSHIENMYMGESKIIINRI